MLSNSRPARSAPPSNHTACTIDPDDGDRRPAATPRPHQTQAAAAAHRGDPVRSATPRSANRSAIPQEPAPPSPDESARSGRQARQASAPPAKPAPLPSPYPDRAEHAPQQVPQPQPTPLRSDAQTPPAASAADRRAAPGSPAG